MLRKRERKMLKLNLHQIAPANDVLHVPAPVLLGADDSHDPTSWGLDVALADGTAWFAIE